MATTTKDDLMSSLMGGGVPQAPTEEEDLFGGIPIVPPATADDSLITEDVAPLGTAPNAILPVTIPPPVASVAPAPVSGTSSLLAASGLLGMANGGPALGASLLNGETNGGGLFDEIDKEAEERAAAERLAAEQEAQRVAQETAQRAAEQEAQRVAQEEAERLRRQQLQDQMQSIHLGAPPNTNMYGMPQQPPQPNYYNPQQQQYAPPQQQYQQYSQQQQAPYNAYPPPQQQSQMYPPPVTRVPDMQLYQDANAASSQPRYYQPHQMGSPTAGMHNHVGGHPTNNMSPYGAAPPMIQPTRPLAVAPGFYTRVLVTEPLLLQAAPVGGFFTIGQAPYWSYQITTECKEQGGVWMVRRRFRHVVALEDRLREDCPGAILPPRYVRKGHGVNDVATKWLTLVLFRISL
jgi:hypothetical protein